MVAIMGKKIFTILRRKSSLSKPVKFNLVIVGSNELVTKVFLIETRDKQVIDILVLIEWSN